MRNENNLYPDFTAEIDALDSGAVNNDEMRLNIIYRIMDKHQLNSNYNRELYNRYRTLENSLPIHERKPRFGEDEKAINNKINNDFFGEIVDFKVGYFAGKPIGYSYGNGRESQEDTGGEAARDEASNTLTDFVTRNNMYDTDMETTKDATTCGYGARLFYIDLDGNERVMTVPPYKAAILSKTNITEPEYGLRYFKTKDINDQEFYKVEFYDNVDVYFYEGSWKNLTLVKKQPHMFDYCPLQGIPNNNEMLGDAEKVLSLIDAYDRTMSDCNNEIESFANSYMVYENVNASDEEIKKAQKTGAIKFFSGAANGRVYFLTKDINDAFTEHHLDRLEDNIYRFSKTPNLSDETFGNASGVSLKFKLTGLETKCGMFQAKMQSAGTYMFKLLASSWAKKRITVDPLQCFMEFSRNFPLDILSEAQAAQAAIGAGLPKEVAYSMCFSAIDDIDYVMQLIEEEQNSIPSLFNSDEKEEVDNGSEGNITEES